MAEVELDEKAVEAATRMFCKSEADCCEDRTPLCTWGCAPKIKNDVREIITAYLRTAGLVPVPVIGKGE